MMLFEWDFGGVLLKQTLVGWGVRVGVCQNKLKWIATSFIYKIQHTTDHLYE